MEQRLISPYSPDLCREAKSKASSRHKAHPGLLVTKSNAGLEDQSDSALKAGPEMDPPNTGFNMICPKIPPLIMRTKSLML